MGGGPAGVAAWRELEEKAEAGVAENGDEAIRAARGVLARRDDEGRVRMTAEIRRDLEAAILGLSRIGVGRWGMQ